MLFQLKVPLKTNCYACKFIIQGNFVTVSTVEAKNELRTSINHVGGYDLLKGPTAIVAERIATCKFDKLQL